VNPQLPADARILIVDDEPANVRVLEKVLKQNGYESLVSVTDPCQAMATFAESSPDLVLLDLHMPQVDGFEVLRAMTEQAPLGSYLPILALTAEVNQEARHRALSEGAKDFLTKPFDHQEAVVRIRNLLETRSLHLQLSERSRILETEVRSRTKELEEARNEILDRLARAAEYRDDATRSHIVRVGRIAGRLAQTLGLPAERCEMIARTAPLHDIGKIGVSDVILLKPGKLTPEEFESVKVHTTIGGEILRGGHLPLLRMARAIALTHHERWDGTGYPRGLEGTDIPLTGRIVSVADVFDALTHERPYKRAWSVEKAVGEIEAQRERQFDPEIVAAFGDVVIEDPRLQRGA